MLPLGFCFCRSDREQIYIGDDNALTLEISAENQGEGAYEAELHVYPPQQADFTGVVRSEVPSLSPRAGYQVKFLILVARQLHSVRTDTKTIPSLLLCFEKYSSNSTEGPTVLKD